MISATPTSVVLRVPKGDKSGGIVLKYGSNSFDVGTYTYQDLSVSKIFRQMVQAAPNYGLMGRALVVQINLQKFMLMAKKLCCECYR